MTECNRRSQFFWCVYVLTAAMLCGGCGSGDSASQTREPTLQEAVEALGQHEHDIVHALRAKNPSAADEAMHDALYYADHLSDFESKVEVDVESLEQSAKQIRELLMQAHRGAHGNVDDWDPVSAADQLVAAMAELKKLVAAAK